MAQLCNVVAPPPDAGNTTVSMESGRTAASNAVYKRGDVVSLNLVVNQFTATSGVWANLGTLPDGYRPIEQLDIIAVNNVTDLGVHVRIGTDGLIRIYVPSGQSTSVTAYISTTFITP